MVTLREKFLGCIASTWIASAMGAAVEGWMPERIKEKHGFVDKLLPYKHYTDITDWERMPGTTEDGIARQTLMATAIIEKGDRILSHDLVAVWLRDLDPERMKYKQERFDRSLLELARAGVPPSELGQLWPYQNVNSMARASHPIGLINAGDPQGAADSTLEVGRVYAKESSVALRWAALYNAAIAEACKPDATVESVLEVARKFATYRAEAGKLYALYDTVQRDVDRALDIAQRHSDYESMRDEFYKHFYGGHYIVYGFAQANEVVSKGLAVFAFTKGNPKAAIEAGVNFGRDTDCLAAVASGLAGALSGPAALPVEWINQVNEATRSDPYTHSHRTIEETADGLYEAFLKRQQKLRAYVNMMSAPALIES